MERSVDGRLTRRRAWAVLIAALIVSLPFALFIAIFGALGLFIWACLFVPALLGNALLLLPIKLLGERRGWSWGNTYLALMTANVALTVALSALFQPDGSPLLYLCLTSVALIAASVWQAFDERALAVPHSPVPRGRTHG